MGNNDNLFDSKISERVKPFYENFGCPNNYVIYVFGGTHEFDKSNRGIDFLFNFLLSE